MRRARNEGLRYRSMGSASRAALRVEWRREAFFRVAGSFTPTLEAVWPSGRFVVSTTDVDVSRLTFISGPFALAAAIDTLGFVRDVLGSDFTLTDGTVLEVGANIGTGSVVFITELGASRVRAFEPAPENFRLLRQTIAANGLADQITAHQLALSNECGHVAFELSPRTWGDHRVRTASPDGSDEFNESTRNVINVPSASIDSLCRDGTLDPAEIKLVWSDTQGHEGFLLAGARDLLATGVPVVVEFWPYGLCRSGCLEMFVDVAQEHYTHFLNIDDLRYTPVGDRRPTREHLRPIADLTALERDYLGKTPAHADLILFAL